MQLAKPAMGGVPPHTGSAWGGLPQDNFQKSTPISCNLRDSEIITFSKVIFPGHFGSKS